MEGPIVRGNRILLVDDEQRGREAFGMMLEVDQHIVTQADDGVTALEVFRPGASDLAIADLLMKEDVREGTHDKGQRTLPRPAGVDDHGSPGGV